MTFSSRFSILVDFKCIAVRLKRPPLVHAIFDIEARNPTDTSQWLLISDQLDCSAQWEGATVNGVEVFRLIGRGQVLVAHFQGIRSFSALLLPAGAAIKIHGLTLSLWNKIPPAQALVRLLVAKHFTVGGEPAVVWLGMAAHSDAVADVSTDNGEMIASRHTPDRSEVPIELAAPSQIDITVDLPSPKLPTN